jgi:hypothetical protein
VVEGRAEGVDIGPDVDLPIPARQLRRDVAGRPDRRADGRLRGLAGQSEVADLRIPLRADEEVPGLDVAVDEPHLLRVLEGVRDLCDILQRALLRHRPFVLEDLLQALPFHVLHDVVEEAPRLAHVEPGDDVRMVEHRRGPGLADEAHHVLAIPGQLRKQDLHRDGLVEVPLLRPVDRAHPPPADGREDLVAGDLLAGPFAALDLEDPLHVAAVEVPLVDEDRPDALRIAAVAEDVLLDRQAFLDLVDRDVPVLQRQLSELQVWFLLFLPHARSIRVGRPRTHRRPVAEYSSDRGSPGPKEIRASGSSAQRQSAIE